MTPNELFLIAYHSVCENGYFDEIEYFRNNKPFEDQDSTTFFLEYVWTVLNAGMKEQVARKIYNVFIEKLDPSKIGHLGKRRAIQEAINNYEIWFDQLQRANNKIDYLETLPWIGPVTKYHLARNIGIDTVKPDRHLVRLAEEYGFASPLELCKEIQRTIPEKLGVIDVILWRYCNLNKHMRGQASLDQE